MFYLFSSKFVLNSLSMIELRTVEEPIKKGGIESAAYYFTQTKVKMEPQNIYTLSNYCAVRTKHKTTPYEITAKAYCCWADDSDSQFFGFVVKLSCFCFWNSFSDDGDRANLLRKNKTF